MLNSYSSIHQGHLTEELKSTLSTKRTEITNAVQTTDHELTALGKKLDEISVADDLYEDDEHRASKVDAVGQIETDRAALNAAKKLLMELLPKVQEDEAVRAAAAKQTSSTKVTFGSQTSGFQIGVSNAPISGITFSGK